jgi:hypothetical protein
MFIGTWFSGFTTDYYTTNGVHQWKEIWFVPAYIAIGVLIYFIIFFKEEKDLKQAA